MEKRLKPLLVTNHPNIELNIKNLGKLQRELENRGLGYFTDGGELVYDSKDEKEISALMDKFLLQ